MTGGSGAASAGAATVQSMPPAERTGWSAEQGRSWEGRYLGTADQVGQVRVALRAFLGRCPVADDVVQLASELAANAIEHTGSGRGGRFTVRVQHFAGDYVWAEVEDQGSGWDGSIARSATAPHGLYLLQELASACGADRAGNRSWVVWFRIDYPAGQHPHSERGHAQ
jgi:anti-sigma regulatory factor (Ser/Thr protein kinase)